MSISASVADRAAIEPDRGVKSEIGRYKWEVGRGKSEVGNRKSEIESRKSELGSGKWEVRSLNMEKQSEIRSSNFVKSEV